MKKVFWGFFIVLLLIVGTALVGPGMIDWNRYKGEATKQVKLLTGRDLQILGDVQVSIFPAPAIIANDVSLSNLPGAATPEMIKLRRAEVRIALSPLLAGQIKVETVRLIEPVIELELLADGRQNWDIQPVAATTSSVAPAPANDASSASPSGSTSSSAPSVILDDFTIVDGALNYRDSKTGTIEKVEALNARIEAASLSGPFQSKGALTLRDIPLTYDITVGELIQERTLPLNMKFGIGAGDSSLHIGGTLLGLPDAPKFKGSLKGEGKNLGLLIEAITRAPAPPALAQLFSVEANISGSATGGELSDLDMRLAGSRVEGDVAFEMAEVPRFSVSLTAGRFDLDKWLAKPRLENTTGSGATANATDGSDKAVSALPATPTAPDIAIVIPNDITGSVIVSVDALVYRGEAINDVLINTELVDGLANLGQFSAQFPGGSDISMSGILSSPDGKPEFNGTLETNTNDLRKVARWLDLELPNVPADRLHKIDYSSTVKLTTSEVQLQNIDLKFDSSRLTGATTIALRSRPALGVNLTLDQIELDAYFPKPSATKPAAVVAKPASDGKTETPGAAGTANSQKAAQAENPLSGLGALSSFDANALIKVKRLGMQGESVRDITVDATLFDGNLNIKQLNVGRFLDVSVAASGRLNDLQGIPSLKGFQVEATTKNVTALARFVGTALPFDAKKLGATSVNLRADGSVLKPTVQTHVVTAGATVSANGVVSVLPVGDLFDLNMKIAHPDLARLLRVLGVNYRPAGKLGALALTTQASGTPTLVNLQKLSGSLGKLKFSGNADVDLNDSVPAVSANLNTGAVILDNFLPAKSSAHLDDETWEGLKRRPAAWPGPDLSERTSPLIKVATGGRWPADPIDLSVLKSFNADVKLKSPLVAYSKYLFENVDVAAQVKDGTLETQRLVARLFGGLLNGNARVTAAKSNEVATVFDITGIQIANALKSVTGNATASGQLNAKMNVTAAGQSVEEIISSLAGTGGFNMTNVDATAGAKGSAFAGIYNLLTSLNQLGSSRSGNKADVSGSFQIAQGIARTNDIKLASALGNGSAQGTVDLAEWLLNIKGQIELQQSALTQILQAKLRRGASPVGFVLSGPLDSPNVKVDTGALLGGSVPIPGADALLNKAPKGVGQLLKGLLGSGATAAPTQATPPPTTSPSSDTPPPARTTQETPPPAKEFRPEDLLKQLFR